MKKYRTLYGGVVTCAVSLALAGCMSDNIRQNQLVGGAVNVCSSAGQSACEDWDAWASSSLTDEQRALAAVAVTEPIEMSEAKIAALIADPAWVADSNFQT